MMRHEAQNLIPLGNVIIGNEGKDKAGWRDPAKGNQFILSCYSSNYINIPESYLHGIFSEPPSKID